MKSILPDTAVRGNGERRDVDSWLGLEKGQGGVGADQELGNGDVRAQEANRPSKEMM